MPISASDCRATSNDFRDLNMQLFVTYIVLFVTAVKARFSDFYFFIADPRVKGLTSKMAVRKQLSSREQSRLSMCVFLQTLRKC